MSEQTVLPAAPRRSRGLTRRQRDFLLLNVFVLARHGYAERARILADAMFELGDESAEVLLARAVLRFSERKWGETLEVLDSLDRIAPMERFGAYKLTDKQRMRRYLKTRSLHELGDKARARDAIDAYMRHGEAGIGDTE